MSNIVCVFNKIANFIKLEEFTSPSLLISNSSYSSSVNLNNIITYVSISEYKAIDNLTEPVPNPEITILAYSNVDEFVGKLILKDYDANMLTVGTHDISKVEGTGIFINIKNVSTVVDDSENIEIIVNAFYGSHTTIEIDSADKENPWRPLSELEMTNISNFMLNGLLVDYIDPSTELLDNSLVMIDRVVLLEPRKLEVKAYMMDHNLIPSRKAKVHVYNYVIDKYYIYLITLNQDDTVNIEETNNDKAYIEPQIVEYAKPAYCCFDQERSIKTTLNDSKFQSLVKERLSVHFPDFDFNNEDDVSNIGFDVAQDSRVKSLYVYQGPFITPFNYNYGDKRICLLSPFWNNIDKSFKNNLSFYSQPFLNFIILFDARNPDTILEIIETSPKIDPNTPLPNGNININWDRPEPSLDSPENIKKLVSSMPDGPSYKYNGRRVEWDNWKFTWSFDPVYGLVIYNITFKDKTVWKVDPNASPVERSILYKASIPEIATTYGNSESAERCFLDMGEYNARDFMVSFVPGLDCPEYADLFDVVTTYPDGSMFNMPNCIALYEVNSLEPVWRHTDYPCVLPSNFVPRGRPGRDLILSSIHVIANYDYTFKWIFSQNGNIEIKMSASGVVECGSQSIQTIIGISEEEEEELASSTLVEKYTGGNYHSHVACVRLDFEIDRPSNSFEVKNTAVEKTIKVKPVDEHNLYGGVWAENEEVIKESCGRMQQDDIVKWSIKNSNSLNYTGYERSYELTIDRRPIDIYNQNQSFVEHSNYLYKNSIYFTKYNDDEQTAAGDVVCQTVVDNGIKKYLEKHDNVEDENIVVWAISGFAHAPRPEDYPVMPTESFSMYLSPEAFFNENPGIYLRKTTDNNYSDIVKAYNPDE